MYNKNIPTKNDWIYIMQKLIKKEVNHLRCKLDGHDFECDNNKSGCCTTYIQNLGVENAKYECKHNFDKYFEMITEEKEFLCCPYCDYSTVDSTNKSGVFTVHLKKVHNITPDILINEHPEYTDLYPTFLMRQENKKLNEEIGITCAICGKKFRKLTRTHLAMHGLTPTEYKRRYHVRTTCSEHTENIQRNASFKGQIDQVFDRIIKNGFTPLFSKNEYYGVDIKYKYKFKCNKCGHIFEDNLDDGNIPICRICDPKQELKPNGKTEKEIRDFLFYECGITNLIANDRTILKPKEIDIVLPDLKIAIEIDGVYWHSEDYGKGKYYHIDKTNAAKKQGYKMIHIFDDEWSKYKDIIKNKLKAITHTTNTDKLVYARECEIRKLTYDQKSNFLIENHLQGDDRRSEFMYGAFHNDNLVAVMTFCKPRKVLGGNRNDNTIELLRFAAKKSYGTFGKLLKYAIDNVFKPMYYKRIYTYADLRYTDPDDNIYISNGFKLDHISQPNYWYVGHNSRKSRLDCQKYKLVNEGADPSKTEKEIMKEKGYHILYDCGNAKFYLDI